MSGRHTCWTGCAGLTRCATAPASAREDESYGAALRFELQVDLPDDHDHAVRELGRILRYWAGGVRRLDHLRPGAGTDVYDSAYRKVGSWRVVEADGTSR